MSLKDELHDWKDIDLAMWYLAQSLGLMSSSADSYQQVKHVFWSNHPIGDLHSKILRDMTSAGVLEYREESDYQYRWDPEFKGAWDNVD